MIAPRLLLVLGVLALSGCADSPFGGRSSGGGSQAQADAQTRAACRQRAEEMDRQQNRAEIYSPPPQMNTPFSASYMPELNDRGLSDRYAHDKMVSDCIRNTGTGADRSAQPASKAPPPPQR
jgi:hypothetical protein